LSVRAARITTSFAPINERRQRAVSKLGVGSRPRPLDQGSTGRRPSARQHIHCAPAMRAETGLGEHRDLSRAPARRGISADIAPHLCCACANGPCRSRARTMNLSEKAEHHGDVAVSSRLSSSPRGRRLAPVAAVVSPKPLNRGTFRERAGHGLSPSVASSRVPAEPNDQCPRMIIEGGRCRARSLRMRTGGGGSGSARCYSGDSPPRHVGAAASGAASLGMQGSSASTTQQAWNWARGRPPLLVYDEDRPANGGRSGENPGSRS